MQQLKEIDGAFTSPLMDLATTIANLVDREAAKQLPLSAAIVEDLFVQIRFSQAALAFTIFMNTDDRRINDIHWRMQYSVLALTSVRSMIDCFYNITTILENPSVAGLQFRLSGIKKLTQNLSDDIARYGSLARWQEDIVNRKQLIDTLTRQAGSSPAAVEKSKTWPTFGTYMREQYAKGLDDRTRFLRSLTLGSWGEYSSLSHAAFDGLVPNAGYFLRDRMPHELRPNVKERFLPVITMHIGRAACLLLATLTEIQVKFHFKGARVNQRLHQAWDGVTQFYEGQEFYDQRYKTLMEKSGILREK